MRRMMITLFFVVYCSTVLHAQQKDFEGSIAYHVNFTSKVEGVSALAWKNLMFSGDSLIMVFKGANAVGTTGSITYYYRPDKQKLYMKIKGIDTLFYLDYHSDTTTVKSITKNADQKKVAGYNCKSITMVTGMHTMKYFYAPDLYRNPDYDKDYKIGGGDVLSREIASIWLEGFERFNYFDIQQTCYRVQPSAVNDNIFILPDLPEKVFSMSSIKKEAQFPGKENGWIRYIQTNLKGELAAKYVKIPKGETTALQTVVVDFMISDQGLPVNIIVLNKDEVHSKLAAEAVRVIAESPVWKPATVLGGKTIFHGTQSITFQATK